MFTAQRSLFWYSGNDHRNHFEQFFLVQFHFVFVAGKSSGEIVSNVPLPLNVHPFSCDEEENCRHEARAEHSFNTSEIEKSLMINWQILSIRCDNPAIWCSLHHPHRHQHQCKGRNKNGWLLNKPKAYCVHNFEEQSKRAIVVVTPSTHFPKNISNCFYFSAERAGFIFISLFFSILIRFCRGHFRPLHKDNSHSKTLFRSFICLSSTNFV